ncbi:hypothetical protein WJX72_002041 [[Myrmecia] bisecta]|uniref:Uncharacterized protein n=1 Tax=[Myrmecia] bisecta TaxID=41462 RepID=A0AAW1R4X9_9CHLO
MATEDGVTRVHLYKQDPQDRGMVQKAKEAVSEQLPKAETKKSDADELDKKDFENAANQAKETVDSMRAQTAEAVTYLQNKLTPSSQDDPEVKDFKQAAKETTGDVKSAVDPKTDKSAGGASKQVADSVYDAAASAAAMVKDAATAVSNKLSPTAQAMERGSGSCAKEERELVRAVDDAEKATVEAAEYVKGRLGERPMTERSANIVRGDVDSATDKLRATEQRTKAGGESLIHEAEDAAVRAKDRVVEGARYVKDRFTAPVTGDERKDREVADKARRTAEEAKDKTVGTAEAAKEKTKGTAEEARERARQTAEEARERTRAMEERAKEEAEDVKERAAKTAEQAKEKASGTYQAAKDKAGELKDRTVETVREAKDKTVETADEVSEGAREQTARLEAEAKGTAARAQAKGQDVVHNVEDAAVRAKDKALETARYIKERFTAPVTGSEHKDREVKESARDKTHETVDAAANKTHRAVDKTADATQQTKRSLEQKTDRAAESTKERAEQAKETAKEKAAQAKQSGESVVEELKGAAVRAEEKVLDSARYVKDRFTAPVTGSQHKDEELKDRAAHTADQVGDKAKETSYEAERKAQEVKHEAGAKTESLEREVEDVAGRLKETVLGSVRYVRDRFTAPVTGDAHKDREVADRATVDGAQAAGVRGDHTAEIAGKKAHDLTQEARARAEESREAARERAGEVRQKGQEAKERTKEEASQLGDELKRSFAAPVAGDENLDREEVVNQDTSRRNGGGFLSAFLPPRDHEAEARREAEAHEQESVFERLKETLEGVPEKIKEEVEEVNRKVHEKAEQWEEEVTPKTPEEALISEGYVPMNTEEVLKLKAEGRM